MDTAYPRPLLPSLAAVADAGTAEELATAVLACILGVVAVDSALVARCDRLGRGSSNWTWPEGFLNGEESDRFERLHREEPWVLATHTRLGRGEPLRISDRLTEHQFHGLSIYPALFRPLEIDHQVAFSLPGGPSGLTCVAVNRSRRNFSDRELESFEMLRRPLAAIMTYVLHRLSFREGYQDDAEDKLSDREMAVLELVVGGHSNGQIGHGLGISVRTVEKHLEHIFAKTGTRNRTDAAVWWLARQSGSSATIDPACAPTRPSG